MNTGERGRNERERESEKEHGRCLILSVFLLSVHIFVHHHNSEAMKDGLTMSYCKIVACNVLELLFC